ncbi:MAG: histidine phosphatase family protein [Akkermansiaceae bacterium]|nr:histidine phosphatase family protein [Akkermansiaceae bacterium]
MKLIIMRHGTAEDFHADGDRSRELTSKGYEQSRRQARRLAGLGLLPSLVLSSPLMRCRQTAETFCAEAGISGPMIQSWLACGMSPETALEELGAYSEFETLAVVGHEPDLSSLVAWITGSEGGSVRMKKATIAVVALSPPSRRGTLELLLPAKQGLGSD